MKLLWHSNAPFVPTGYGQQTALFAPKVRDAGYDVAISCFYGLEGARLKWEGIDLLPGQQPDFGNQFLLQHAKDYFGDLKSGIVFALMDIFVLSPHLGTNINLVSWCPVDHDPISPGVASFFPDSGAIPIAMSRFGEEQLRAAGLDPLYAPHGVDTKIYRPHWDARKEISALPESAFVVGMVAANKGRPSRKCFLQALQAFAVFRQRHDDAVLYLHTVSDPVHGQGENIMAIAQAVGLREEFFFVAPRYNMIFNPIPPASMAKLYSCFDVLLNPSMGEGFGVPILEAAACGVPSIVTNITAMPEVAGDYGWTVGSRGYWTAGNSWQGVPDVEEIVARLEEAYAETDQERRERSANVRAHALTYDVDTVTEDYLLPALKVCEERFDGVAPIEFAELGV